jgi:hypothetical protein
MLDRFIDLIQSPFKSLLAVITGTATGYAPEFLSVMLNSNPTRVDTFFQHTVWLITFCVGITALITWVQKQVDRWRGQHKKQADEPDER